MSSAESQEPASSTKKDNDNENGRTNTTAKDPHQSSPFFKKEGEIWQTVPPKGQHRRPPKRGPHRGGTMGSNTASGASSKSAPHQKQRNEGPEEIRGRGFWGRKGRGRGSKQGRSQEKGAAGKYVFFLPLCCPMEKDTNRALIGTIGLRCCCSIDHYKYFVCRI